MSTELLEFCSSEIGVSVKMLLSGTEAEVQFRFYLTSEVSDFPDLLGLLFLRSLLHLESVLLPWVSDHHHPAVFANCFVCLALFYNQIANSRQVQVHVYLFFYLLMTRRLVLTIRDTQ